MYCLSEIVSETQPTPFLVWNKACKQFVSQKSSNLSWHRPSLFSLLIQIPGQMCTSTDAFVRLDTTETCRPPCTLTFPAPFPPGSSCVSLFRLGDSIIRSYRRGPPGFLVGSDMTRRGGIRIPSIDNGDYSLWICRVISAKSPMNSLSF